MLGSMKFKKFEFFEGGGWVVESLTPAPDPHPLSKSADAHIYIVVIYTCL